MTNIPKIGFLSLFKISIFVGGDKKEEGAGVAKQNLCRNWKSGSPICRACVGRKCGHAFGNVF
jgi:hypothetical protein